METMKRTQVLPHLSPSIPCRCQPLSSKTLRLSSRGFHKRSFFFQFHKVRGPGLVVGD